MTAFTRFVSGETRGIYLPKLDHIMIHSGGFLVPYLIDTDHVHHSKRLFGQFYDIPRWCSHISKPRTRCIVENLISHQDFIYLNQKRIHLIYSTSTIGVTNTDTPLDLNCFPDMEQIHLICFDVLNYPFKYSINNFVYTSERGYHNHSIHLCQQGSIYNIESGTQAVLHQFTFFIA
jgi:hypothetical protein